MTAINALARIYCRGGCGANWLQACCACIQVITWSSTLVPCWWTLPVGGSQPTTSPSFSAIFITGRPPYASVNHRRQSFSCRRRTCVERSAAARNVCILSVYFSQTSEDSSLPVLLPLTVSCLSSDFCDFWHANRSCYLLTLPVLIYIQVFPLFFLYLVSNHAFIFFTSLFLLGFHTRTLGSNVLCRLFVVLNPMSIT